MTIPDFGKHIIDFESGGYPIKLECRYIAPGLTFQDIVNIFHGAKSQARPGDELAGDPSKWPDNRGIYAVVMAVLSAVYDKA